MITLAVGAATLIISALTLYILIVVGLDTMEKKEAFQNSAAGKLIGKFFPTLAA